MTTETGIARARQLAHEVADLIFDLKERMEEVGEILPVHDFVLMVGQQLGSEALAWCGRAALEIAPRAEPTDAAHAIRAQIDVLFEEAPKPLDGTSPAVQDVAFVLRGWPSPVSGVLTKCPTGVLKLGAVTQLAPKDPPVLIEHFFAYEDVVAIVVRREVKTAQPSMIITSH